MRLAPIDNGFREGLRRIVQFEARRQRSLTGWIGQDNLLHITTFDELLGETSVAVAMAFRDRIQFKALLRIEYDEDRERRHSVALHLDTGELYGLNAFPERGRAAWCTPDEDIADALLRLREV